MVQNQKGLTIEQLEERFEMVVASKGSSDDDLNPDEWITIKL